MLRDPHGKDQESIPAPKPQRLDRSPWGLHQGAAVGVCEGSEGFRNERGAIAGRTSRHPRWGAMGAGARRPAGAASSADCQRVLCPHLHNLALGCLHAPRIMPVSGRSPSSRAPRPAVWATGPFWARWHTGAVSSARWATPRPPGPPRCSPFTRFQSPAFVNKALRAFSRESLCRHGFLFPLSGGLGLEFLGLVGNSCLNFQRNSQTGLQSAASLSVPTPPLPA